MKPHDKIWPETKGAGDTPRAPATPAQQFKPAVAQAKGAARHPVAPAVYRPQAKAPAAPPAYRPQAKAPVAQRKAAVAPPTKTPPAHQTPPRVVQQKRPPPRAAFNSRTIQRAQEEVERGSMLGGALLNMLDPPEAPAPAPVERKDEKKPTKEEYKARKDALKLLKRQEAKVKADAKEGALPEWKIIYAKGAAGANDYVATHSAQQLTALGLKLNLARTYSVAAGGYGGEYQFPVLGRTQIGGSVIHVHWNNLGNLTYAHFKDYGTVGMSAAVSGVASLGDIDRAKLTALGVALFKTPYDIQTHKKYNKV